MTVELTHEQASILRLVRSDASYLLFGLAQDIARFPADTLHRLVWHDGDSFGLTDAGREALALSGI